MKKEMITLPIREIAEGFAYDRESDQGITAMGGRLVLQPAYQRNYFYADGTSDVALVESLLEFPMLAHPFIMRRVEDGTLEMVDGQQRATTVCRYVSNMFAVPEFGFFRDLSEAKQQEILAIEAIVLVCEGTDAQMGKVFLRANADYSAKAS